MDAGFAGQLRVERDGDDIALPHRHDPLIGQSSQNLYTGSHALDYGGSDEDRVDRPVAQDRHRQIGLERVELAAEGVALDRHVDQREDGLLAAGDLLGDDDHARARAQNRGAGPGKGHDRLAQIPASDELAHGRALAARQDQAGDAFEVLGQPNRNRLDSDGPKGLDVFDDGAVKRQYANLHHALRIRASKRCARPHCRSIRH